MNRKNFSLAVFAAILISVSLNCAFTDRVVTIPYDKGIVPKSIETKKVIYIGEFSEKIFSPRQGIVKNGYGWETANVYTLIRPEEILKKAISVDLKNFGYEVVNSDNKKQYPRVNMKINQMFAEHYLRLWDVSLDSVIDADIIVELSKDKIFKRRIKGIGRYSFMFNLCIECTYTDSYIYSLNDFNTKTVSAIHELIK